MASMTEDSNGPKADLYFGIRSEDGTSVYFANIRLYGDPMNEFFPGTKHYRDIPLNRAVKVVRELNGKEISSVRWPLQTIDSILGLKD
jgi:hypothetical protein